jgi:hypothetical protein
MPAMVSLYGGFLAFHHIMPSAINNTDSEPDSLKPASTVDRLRNYNSVLIKDISEGIFSLLSK